MDDETYAAAARAIDKLDVAVAALPADELEALRAVAAADDEHDVVAFGDFNLGPSFAGGGDSTDNLFAAMMAYQKMLNHEARADRRLGPSANTYPDTTVYRRRPR